MKKRLEFVAIGYSYSEAGDSKCMKFDGENDGQYLKVTCIDSGVFVDCSDVQGVLKLEGAGLIGRVGWLYLGLEKEEILRRIGVFVGHLNHFTLDRDMRALIDESAIRYGHLQPRERIVVTKEGLVDDGDIYQAIVWDSESDSIGSRVTLRASDPLKAKSEVKRRFGDDMICTIFNERRSTEPRH